MQTATANGSPLPSANLTHNEGPRLDLSVTTTATELLAGQFHHACSEFPMHQDDDFSCDVLPQCVVTEDRNSVPIPIALERIGRPGISRAPRGGFGRDFEVQPTWSSEVSNTSSAETDHWQAPLTCKLSFLFCPKHGRDVRTARPDCMRNDPSAHTIDHSEAEIWGSAPWERVAHLLTKCTST